MTAQQKTILEYTIGTGVVISAFLLPPYVTIILAIALGIAVFSE